VVAEATGSGVAWIEVTGNEHAAEFYGSAGFVRVGDEQTLSVPRRGCAGTCRHDAGDSGYCTPGGNLIA
jgi:hypothetical protein